ncbi:hypothetical protein KOW79_000161 [Hemibagrus wyckioides]|uniref:Uncharacterized protein n=1 Tax=Hemibagrus wyckioides TaxID=337641 RepID=A0A9D3P6A1_9TELE|nr:hypothetical protein KOW79_000161 [Hemibagrus wyckioides]
MSCETGGVGTVVSRRKAPFRTPSPRSVTLNRKRAVKPPSDTETANLALRSTAPALLAQSPTLLLSLLGNTLVSTGDAAEEEEQRLVSSPSLKSSETRVRKNE